MQHRNDSISHNQMSLSLLIKHLRIKNLLPLMILQHSSVAIPHWLNCRIVFHTSSDLLHPAAAVRTDGWGPLVCPGVRIGVCWIAALAAAGVIAAACKTVGAD